MDYISNLIKPNVYTLSEISRDIGQVFFAGIVVVEPIISQNASLVKFMIGLTLSIFFWFISMKVTTK